MLRFKFMNFGLKTCFVIVYKALKVYNFQAMKLPDNHSTTKHIETKKNLCKSSLFAKN